MKLKVLAMIWVPVWLALIPVAILSLPPAPTAAVALSGAAAFALPVSLGPLAVTAIVLFLCRRRQDRGLPLAVTIAAVATVAMGSSILRHPPYIPAPSATVSTVGAARMAPTPETAERAAERARFETNAAIFGAADLALATLNALLYFSQPMLGARRIAAVAGVAAAIATGLGIAFTITEWADQLVLLFFAVASAAGLIVTFVLLLALACFRWIRAGFTNDRSRRSEPGADPKHHAAGANS